MKNELYKKIIAKYPRFIKSCNELFFNNFNLFEKYIKSFYSIDVNIDELSGETTEIKPESITSFAINSIYGYIQISYPSIEDEKTKIREYILDTKRNLKKKVLKDDFFHAENSNGEDTKRDALTWLKNKNKLMLFDFPYFDNLSASLKIKFLLKDLENIISNIPSENQIMIYPQDLYFPVLFGKFRQNLLPTFEYNKNNKINIFYDFETEPRHHVRIYLAEDQSVETEETSKEGKLLAIQKELNKNNNSMPDEFDQRVLTAIYNLLDFDCCKERALEIKIETIVDLLHPEKMTRSDKAYWKQRVIDSINKIVKITYKDYFVDENGKSDIKDSIYGSYMITEAQRIGEKEEGLWRLGISFSVCDSWLNTKNNIVLSEDYERVSRESKQLLFYLQKKRVDSRKDNYEAIIPLSSFKKEAYLVTNIQDKRYIKKIISSLDELKLLGLLIKDYEQELGLFKINFIPLNEFEMKAYKIKESENKDVENQ